MANSHTGGSKKFSEGTPAASILFEIWGSWILVKKFHSPGKFPKNFNFQTISQSKIRFFQANFRKIKKKLDVLGKYWLYTAIGYFWANYSISLQKSPLSNILPVHNKI